MIQKNRYIGIEVACNFVSINWRYFTYVELTIDLKFCQNENQMFHNRRGQGMPKGHRGLLTFVI